MDRFVQIRKELDEAITYGQFQLAKGLIIEGMHEARNQELLGEMEYFKGQECILMEDYLGGIGHFDKAVKYNPKDGASFNDRALCMVELGMTQEAFSYFDRGIEVEPDYATVYHNKGWLLNKVGRHSEAIEYFNKALELEPDRAVTYENLGDAFRNLGNYADALKTYKKAIELLKPAYSEIKRQLLSHIQQLEKDLNP